MKVLAYDKVNNRVREVKLLDFENDGVQFTDHREQDWTVCKLSQIELIEPISIPVKKVGAAKI